jgi:hypothetical protein
MYDYRYTWHHAWHPHHHILLIGMMIVLGLYFLPTLLAWFRGTLAAGGIFLVNLLFGWTMIGWIGCLIWAMAGTTREQLAYRSYAPPPGYYGRY